MEYLKKQFSVFFGGKEYDKNYNHIFRKSLWEKITNYINRIIIKLFFE